MSEPVVDDERIAYKVSHVAHLLECSRAHLYNLIARGELKSIKLGARGASRAPRSIAISPNTPSHDAGNPPVDNRDSQALPTPYPSGRRIRRGPAAHDGWCSPECSMINL